MKSLKYTFLVISMIAFSCSEKSEISVDLSGEWHFQIDPEDQGEKRKWFETDLPETVKLPGSMVENGKGYEITLETQWTGGFRNRDWYKDPNYAPYHDPDNIRFPFWLQPEKKYTGAAWYQKKVVLTEKLEGRNVWLKLERPHWESTLWVNGNRVGMQNSLATPHVFNVTPFLNTGENTFSIRIDNRIKEIDPGENSHSISDHTQTNWNGIVGELSLKFTGNIYFENVKIFPDVENRAAEIRASVFNNFPEQKNVKFSANATLRSTGKTTRGKSWEFTLSPGENLVYMNYHMGEDALLWDEFNPNVYDLSLTLNSEKETDKHTTGFGLREFKADGSRFTVNGRQVFLRGTLECAIFPITGYPPTDVESWKKVYKAVKKHGLNHVRFHSWCPPQAAFTAADEMGIYLQAEASSWPPQLGSGLPIDQYILDESKRIIEAYGNHPSFVMLSSGNEPGGPGQRDYLTEFVSYWKDNDNRRVYTGAAGWPVLEVNDFHNIPEPRLHRWGEQLNSVINAEPPKTSFDWSERLTADGFPVVSHEIGQWCVYPNFKEIEKYTGVLKARNFELFRESLSSNHMGHLADSFLLASGKLQALCYKADIEAALRTPDFAGFQLLDLHDFPGQGTALIGILDPFWEEKGYISPEEFRRFSNTTVPLARLEKFIFTEGETLSANIEVAHFGERPLQAINPVWKLTSNNTVVAEGTLGQREIPIGNCVSLGKIVYKFQKENRPRKLTLEVGIGAFENSWDIWVYPENQISGSNSIKIVEKLDQATLNFLEDGGKVLLTLGKGRVSPDMGGNVGVGFSSIFWNTAWTDGQKPHTLGILCNPKHPALDLFPTEYHSNWQWWDAMSHSDAIQLDSFPVELQPIVRIIDDWVSNRRLALLFEAKVGDGSILISGVDLVNNMQNRAEARQLKKSLLNYMAGNHFSPGIQLSGTDINKIVK
jgi:hypothetical protein